MYTSYSHPLSINQPHPSSAESYPTTRQIKKAFNENKYEIGSKDNGLRQKLYLNLTKQKSYNRNRDIIWFGPSFNKNVKGNICKTFIKPIDKHFK